MSRRWVAVGYSLGGHAALALAPVTQWALLICAGRDPAAPVQPTTFYAAHTLELTSLGAFRARDWFTTAGEGLVREADVRCIDDLSARAAGLNNGAVFTHPASAADELTRWHAAQEIPLSAYPRPVQVAHGTADALPALFSEITVGQLAAAGSRAHYIPVPGADHFTLLPTIAPRVVEWAGLLVSPAAPRRT